MDDLRKKNRKIALAVLGTVVCMTSLAFASVPLYNLFCRVTGYGGTTQLATAAPATAETGRSISVTFNADTARDLAWDFRPEQREVSVHPGEKKLISYKARNKGNAPLAGTALYNVSPAKAGKYFKKIECFCFGEQILQPGEDVSMPVVFFIDPDITKDRSMNDVTNITLSYNFFKTESPELDKAMEDFYNQSPN